MYTKVITMERIKQKRKWLKFGDAQLLEDTEILYVKAI